MTTGALWYVEVSRLDQIARKIRGLEPQDEAIRLSAELVALPLLPGGIGAPDSKYAEEEKP